MNIFAVNHDPIEAAISLHDSHVVKMIVESGQLLSTAHRYLDGYQYSGPSVSGKRTVRKWLLQDEREPVLYAATFMNHPCGYWVRDSVQNYTWLAQHFLALLSEYTHRYERRHKAEQIAPFVSTPPSNIRKSGLDPFAMAMPDKYKNDDPVIAYRSYYNGEKLFPKGRPARWTNREKPVWIIA